MLELIESLEGSDKGFARISVSFAGTSEPIHVTSQFAYISAAIHPASGTARIEFTLSALASVVDNTAKWIPWNIGDVSSSEADSFVSVVTAVRGIASTTAVLEICAR